MAADLATLKIKVDATEAKTADVDLAKLETTARKVEGQAASTAAGVAGMGLEMGSAAALVGGMGAALGLSALAGKVLEEQLSQLVNWQQRHREKIDEWAKSVASAANEANKLRFEIEKENSWLNNHAGTLVEVGNHQRALAKAKEEALSLGPKYRAAIAAEADSYDGLRRAIEKVNAAELVRVNAEIAKLEKQSAKAAPGKGTAFIDSMMAGFGAAAPNAGIRALEKQLEIEEKLSQLHKTKAALLPGQQFEEKTKESSEKATKALKDRVTEEERFIQVLQAQSDTLGMSRAEVLEYRAANLKLSDAQRAVVEAEVAKIRAFEEGNREAEQERQLRRDQARELQEIAHYTNQLAQRRMDDVLAIRASIQPMQAYEARLAEINRLQRAGLIGIEEANVARANAKDLIPEDVKTQQQKWIEDVERLNALYDAGALGLDAYRERMIDIQMQGESAFASLARSMEIVSGQMSAGFTRFVTTGKFEFSSLVSSILADLAKLYANKAFSYLLQMGLNWLVGSFTSSGSTASTGGWDDASIGMRAAGGPVTGGSPYIVGERGPELFVPGSSGAIVPNAALAGAGTVQISTVMNFYSDGSSDRKTSTSGSDANDARQLRDSFDAMATEWGVRQMRPGGIFHRGRAL